MTRVKKTIWIVGDQLSPRIRSLAGTAPEDCVVFMAESRRRAGHEPYHKQKLAFLWAAMRHFADELRELGYDVDYHEQAASYSVALQEHVRRYRPASLRLMETAESGASGRLAATARRCGLDAELTPNNQFISDKGEFGIWAKNRKQLRMETFYRHMRQKTGLLLDDGEPVGGLWNYDRHNRKTPPADQPFPEIAQPESDATTERVIGTVRREYDEHFGDVDSLWLPVTRAEAERFATEFLDQRLDLFGPYQDAIVAGQRTLHHSLLSSLLNVGLLDPLELCKQAEKRYRDGSARIESVEGFVRQILGWREFIYQIHHLVGPGYEDNNFFNADVALPPFFWDADTDMACVADAVSAVIERGHNHHIQRLMITGNFALIAGLDPREVNRWYRIAYTDAYDWVVNPNVLGMALFADGGLFASKPYAASANYIDKMSDCCRTCAYDPGETTGDGACPFNSLYWDFVDRNEKALASNPRMGLIRKNWQRRDAATQERIRRRAASIRQKLHSGKRL